MSESTSLGSKKAFTLLELIVVVVVLGILAALAIPSFSTVKQSAADKIAVQSAESVVRNAKALAAFDGAALSDAYVDQAGSEIGVKYNSSTNTVTTTSGGETGAASINATTGAVTISGSTPPASNVVTYSAGWMNEYKDIDVYGGYSGGSAYEPGYFRMVVAQSSPIFNNFLGTWNDQQTYPVTVVQGSQTFTYQAVMSLFPDTNYQTAQLNPVAGSWDANAINAFPFVSSVYTSVDVNTSTGAITVYVPTA